MKLRLIVLGQLSLSAMGPGAFYRQVNSYNSMFLAGLE